MSAAVTSRRERVRATVRMPRLLYDEARNFVAKETSPADNINDFFVAAICAYVKLLKRKQIDALFSGMAEDVNYQKEAMLISEEFSGSDWEAFEIAEREPVEA
jgi:hypothetical protein